MESLLVSHGAVARAETGDKTQIATIAMAVHSRRVHRSQRLFQR
jgi:putative Ca2+/H+ antiporter (TMEM165/GDT1 family)